MATIEIRKCHSEERSDEESQERDPSSSFGLLRMTMFGFIQINLILMFFFAPLFNSFAATTDKTERPLQVNRLMLARFKADHARLANQQALRPNLTRERQLTNLGYKIKALSEDIDRLLEIHPQAEAKLFLKDLLLKESRTPKDPSIYKDKTPVLPQTAQMHEDALEFVATNNLKEAIRVYEEIILTDPNDDQAYLLMGHCLLLSGDYEKAENAFYHAAEIDPQNRDEIIPFYQNAVIQYPDDDSAHADLGYAWLVLGDYLKAKEIFGDALAINPGSEKALRGLEIIKARGN